jgi:hypothetical protein
MPPNSLTPTTKDSENFSEIISRPSILRYIKEL